MNEKYYGYGLVEGTRLWGIALDKNGLVKGTSKEMYVKRNVLSRLIERNIFSIVRLTEDAYNYLEEEGLDNFSWLIIIKGTQDFYDYN